VDPQQLGGLYQRRGTEPGFKPLLQCAETFAEWNYRLPSEGLCEGANVRHVPGLIAWSPRIERNFRAFPPQFSNKIQ
jgi:hypothetical protein